MTKLTNANQVGKNLSTDDITALDYLNDKFQSLAGDIYHAYKGGTFDAHRDNEPAGLYKPWLAKLTFDSDNSHINALGYKMLAKALNRHPQNTSIFDAEAVLYDVLNQINDYYRPYWQAHESQVPHRSKAELIKAMADFLAEV